MTHALLIIGSIIGFIAASAGVGMFGADAMGGPYDGRTGNAGCAVFMIGAVLFGACFSALGGN
jgi:hypothetical protein